MFALKWPWVAGHRKGKEKMKPNDWWGDPKRKWGSLPLNGSKYKKSEFLSKSRGRRTIAISLRAKDKRLRHERPESLKPALKTVQSLLARERREILQWNPVKKNKISNFGTFSLYTQILLPLSLSIWKRIKAKKRHLYSWTILLYIFDILNVYIYIYITVVKNLCISILPCGLCYYSMLSFQLLFALHYLA